VFFLNLDWEGGLVAGLQSPLHLWAPLARARSRSPTEYFHRISRHKVYAIGKRKFVGVDRLSQNTERQTRKAQRLGQNLRITADRPTLKHTQSENGKVQMMSSHESAVRIVPHTPESPSDSSAGKSNRANLYQHSAFLNDRTS
jgi:hypothetical protein